MQVVCSNNRNYTTHDTYSHDLKALLYLLSIPDHGFRSSSIRQDQGRTFPQALCRADQSPNQCRGCIRAASDEIVSACFNQTEGFIFFEFCMVQYSNDKLNTSDPYDKNQVFVDSNNKNASNLNQYFREDRARLLADLLV